MANILIVEDDCDLNAAYETILKASGHHVKTAYNGQEALKKLKNYKPRLILLDLLMPIMNGLEFLENYQPKKNSGVNVLLFTNMETSPDIDEAYKLGVKSVVVKSMTSPMQLSALVKDLLKK
jgi:two-component system alkaline phosphatase synthesis response regulator PhoP